MDVQKSNKLFCEGLPPNITETKLKVFFRNSRRQGGGEIDEIKYEQGKACAVITFKEVDAVDLIISRGATVTIDEYTVSVRRFYNTVPPVYQKFESVDLTTDNSATQINHPMIESGEDNKTQTVCAILGFEFTRLLTKESFFKAIQQVIEGNGSITKDLVLDGLSRKVIAHVKLVTSRDILSFCIPRPELKILRVDILENDDVQYYKDCISIHVTGTPADSCDLELVKNYVEKKTSQSVQHTEQYPEEKRSAIFVFSNHSCDAFMESWNISSEDDGIFASPVTMSPTFCICGEASLNTIHGLINQAARGKLKYLTQMENSAFLIEFLDAAESQKVIAELEKNDLKCERYYHCLTSEAYKANMINRNNDRNRDEHKFKKVNLFEENLKFKRAHSAFWQAQKGTFDFVTKKTKVVTQLKDLNVDLYSSPGETCILERINFCYESKIKTTKAVCKDNINKSFSLLKQTLRNAHAWRYYFTSDSESSYFNSKYCPFRDKYLLNTKCILHFNPDGKSFLVIGMEDSFTILKNLVCKLLNEANLLVAKNLFQNFEEKDLDELDKEQNKAEQMLFPKQSPLSKIDEEQNMDTTPAKSEIESESDKPAGNSTTTTDDIKREEHKRSMRVDRLQLLLNTRTFKELEKEEDVIVEIDIKNADLIIKYSIGQNIQKILLNVLSKIDKIDFRHEIFHLEDTRTKNALENKDILNKVTDFFVARNINVVQEIEGDNLKISYINSGDLNLNFVKSVLSNFTETIKISSSEALLFHSEEKLSELLSTYDDQTLFKYDREVSTFFISGLPDERKSARETLERFMSKNEMTETHVPIPLRKKKYIHMFFNKVISDLKSEMTKNGADLSEKDEGFDIKGLKRTVDKGSTQLTHIRDSICCQPHPIKLHGIKEFLGSKEGKEILKLAEKHQCMADITSPSEDSSLPANPAAKVVQTPTKVATCLYKERAITILHGDVTAVTKVDAVICPLSRSSQNYSGVTKAIFKSGGPSIQAELAQRLSTDRDTIVCVNGGQMNYQKVVFMFCSVNSGDPQDILELRKGIVLSLKEVSALNLTSVAIPACGSGSFKFETLPSTKAVKDAIVAHFEHEQSNLREIVLCDISGKNVTGFMERLENFEEFEKLSDVVEINKGSYQGIGAGAIPKIYTQDSAVKRMINDVKVNVETGEITRQRTEAIVVSIDKSLDLSKGVVAKLIKRFGGDEIQNELRTNYPDGLQCGEFATTSGGNLKNEKVFHAILSRYSGNNNQLEHVVGQILEECAKLDVKSVAIPALGTGNIGYPPDESARAIRSAIVNFSKRSTSLKSISLIILAKEFNTLQAFGQCFGSDRSLSQAVAIPKRTLNRKSKFGNLTVEFKKGDLLKEKCDAVVCAVKESMDLKSSGAVAKNFLKSCGEEFQNECSAASMSDNQLTCVDVPTMSFKHVILVSMDRYSRDWQKGLENIIDFAEENSYSHIAVPALGAGSKHANIKVLKSQYMKAIAVSGKKGFKSLSIISIVIYDEHVLQEFMREESVKGPAPSSAVSQDEDSLRKVSSEIKLSIMFKEPSKFQAAVSELDASLGKTFSTSQYSYDEVKHVNEKQERLLLQTAHDLCLKIRIERNVNKVVVEGFDFNKNLQKFNESLNKCILEAFKNHQRSIAAAVPLSIKWQYENPDGRFKSFDNQATHEIEAAYKLRSKSVEVTDMNNRKYFIDLVNKIEYGVDDNGAKMKQGLKIRRIEPSEGESLPKRWVPMKPDETVKRVQLKPDCDEFKKVAKKFADTGGGVPITKIERIQNRALYQQYKVKKRNMDSVNPKGYQNEKRLYHGTDEATVPSILESGFNRSYSGKNATVYGEGVYFAVNASYSRNYSAQGSSGRMMFQVRVLVGECITSSSGMRTLPMKPGKKVPYDSGTNGSDIYVIFHDSQAYPEYLITF